MNKSDAISRIGFAVVIFLMQLMIIFNAVTALLDGTFFPEDNGIRLSSFEISGLTDEQIIDVANYCRTKRCIEKTDGESSGIEDKAYSDVDVDTIEFNCENMVGIDTIHATKAENCKLAIDINSEVTSGNMRIVIISNGHIVEYVDVGESVHLEYSVTDAQEYYVKLLCENAKLSVSVRRTVTPV